MGERLLRVKSGHGSGAQAVCARQAVGNGLIRAQIIWAKERLVIGRGDYHWQHEPCWYAVRQKGNWTGDRKQTTLWAISSREQDAETVHGTQKPVECMRRPILNNSDPGDGVYDPFLGSGTTLIAAETTGRALSRSRTRSPLCRRRHPALAGLHREDGKTDDQRSDIRSGG